MNSKARRQLSSRSTNRSRGRSSARRRHSSSAADESMLISPSESWPVESAASNNQTSSSSSSTSSHDNDNDDHRSSTTNLTNVADFYTTLPESRRSSTSQHLSKANKSKIIVRKFRKLQPSELTASPAPDVKIGQRVAYKEYYGNEFGTIRWIGRVPQISPDWTAGVEFDNAIGEGDGSLHGRRYFIAKDCFAKFLPLDAVTLVDQHVGRPEPGTMISVMSAASRPGQLISIQRVSTVHVQHCFLNAPHRRPGPEIPLLAVNNRLHCQCPNCGPCAHVIKPPRTQRLARPGKNATHMCQFSTYTCCGMESQEDAICTYKGNRPIALPPPSSSNAGLPPVGNSWMAGSGYLTLLQNQQIKSMPDEYRLGAAPEDANNNTQTHRRHSKSSSRRSSARVDDSRDNQHRHTNLRSRSRSINSRQHSEYTNTLSDDDVDNDEDFFKAADTAVFRNSIDNRYLYPTEDPIDSTLEADLEKLSQARYGNRNQHHNLVQHNPSKNLLKGLKSLISCLRTKPSNSEFNSELDNYNYAVDIRLSNDDVDVSRQTFTKNHTSQEFYSFAEQSSGRLDQDMESESNKQQVSSSSDCGFSSASQDSNTRLSPLKSSRRDLIESQVYMRIASRLVESPLLSDEDIPKLRKVLCENQDVQNFERVETDLDQIIADIIGKILIDKGNSIIPSQLSPTPDQQLYDHFVKSYDQCLVNQQHSTGL